MSKHRILPIAILLPLFLFSGLIRADTVSATASANATVQPGGPRTGSSGTNYFNIEGANNGSFASWGALDFNVASFNLAYTATAISNLSISFTEANGSFTVASGSMAFYLVTDTTSSILNNGTSTLFFDSANAPEGLGTQLGNTPFLLGTGTFSAIPANGIIDTYSLTLSTEAQTYFLSQLNTSSAILRLVVTPTAANTASTWAGATSATTTNRPKLSFDVTLDQPTLIWIGGSGTWNPTGGTDWSGGSWDSTKNAVFQTGTAGVVTLGDAITTNGIKFNTTGYTINSNGHALTLSSSAGGNAISVANAGDTASVNAPIAGTAGLTKTGAGTLSLAEANTFTGTVTVNQGVLLVAQDSNFGDPGNGITLNGGTLRQSAISTLVVGAGRTLSGSGTLDASTGSMVFAGPVNVGGITLTPNSSVTFSGSSATLNTAALEAGSVLTISAPVSGSARTTFTGDGSVHLNGDNSSFTGGFQMNKGAGSTGPTLIMDSHTALGSNTLYLNAGTLQATTDMTGGNAITTGVSLGGNATLTGSDMEFSGSFGFYGAYLKTFTVENNVTIDSSISPGGNAFDTLIKSGPGKLTLKDLNGYDDGTQVLAGTIEVTSSGALGIGSVTISPGAMLTLETDAGIDDGSSIFLLSNAGLFAKLDLNFDSSFSETVQSLFIDGVAMPAGTYKASDLPDFLTGTGSLNVLAVPEPNAILLVFAGSLVMFAAVRRSRSA